MKILREGDRGTALAPNGRGWVPVTYEYRTVRLERQVLTCRTYLSGSMMRMEKP